MAERPPLDDVDAILAATDSDDDVDLDANVNLEDILNEADDDDLSYAGVYDPLPSSRGTTGTGTSASASDATSTGMSSDSAHRGGVAHGDLHDRDLDLGIQHGAEERHGHELDSELFEDTQLLEQILREAAEAADRRGSRSRASSSGNRADASAAPAASGATGSRVAPRDKGHGEHDGGVGSGAGDMTLESELLHRTDIDVDRLLSASFGGSDSGDFMGGLDDCMDMDDVDVVGGIGIGCANGADVLSGTGPATGDGGARDDATAALVLSQKLSAEAAMQRARLQPLASVAEHEWRLLASGRRDVSSPLVLKRRAKRSSGSSTSVKSNGAAIPGGAQSYVAPNAQDMAALALLAAGSSGQGAGVVRVSALATITRQLAKNAQYKAHGPGLPTAVAVHSKFIAVGTSRSLVLVFDHFQEVRQVLGSTAGEKNDDGRVTALDVSRRSDFLCCGYSSGRIVLFDIMRGASLKAVTDAHRAPLRSLRFVTEGKPNVVTVDDNGLVNRVLFNKSLGLMWTAEIECLLDGATGKIPSLTPLLFRESAASASASSAVQSADGSECDDVASVVLKREGYCLIALSSERSSFVVAVEPSVEVVFKWPRPKCVVPSKKPGADPAHQPPAPYAGAALPCLAFKWAVVGAGGGATPTLARGWGAAVELLQLRFPKGHMHRHAVDSWPTFTVVASHQLRESAHDSGRHSMPCFVLALEWLSETVLVFLTSAQELVVFNTVEMQEVEVVAVSTMQLAAAPYAPPVPIPGSTLARATSADADAPIAPPNAAAQTITPSTYSAAFRAADNALYMLGLRDLRKMEVQTWKQRTETLVEDGEWLEALALALDHYEGTLSFLRIAKDREDTPGQQTGGSKQSKHELERELRARVPLSVREHVAELLLDYVELAIANAPELDELEQSLNSGTDAQTKASMNAALRQRSLIMRPHYKMLGGVCIEYCIVTGRTDLLFGSIYAKFCASAQAGLFVELLEPYILNESLTKLAPEVMDALVKHSTLRGRKGAEAAERCLLHLDVRHLDFHAVLTLCLSRRLLVAALHVFNSGMRDFTTPVDVLLLTYALARREANNAAHFAMEMKASTGKTVTSGSEDASESSATAEAGDAASAASSAAVRARNTMAQIGARLLLYLRRIFKGLTFPHPNGTALATGAKASRGGAGRRNTADDVVCAKIEPLADAVRARREIVEMLLERNPPRVVGALREYPELEYARGRLPPSMVTQLLSSNNAAAPGQQPSAAETSDDMPISGDQSVPPNTTGSESGTTEQPLSFLNGQFPRLRAALHVDCTEFVGALLHLFLTSAELGEIAATQTALAEGRSFVDHAMVGKSNASSGNTDDSGDDACSEKQSAKSPRNDAGDDDETVGATRTRRGSSGADRLANAIKEAKQRFGGTGSTFQNWVGKVGSGVSELTGRSPYKAKDQDNDSDKADSQEGVDDSPLDRRSKSDALIGTNAEDKSSTADERTENGVVDACDDTALLHRTVDALRLLVFGTSTVDGTDVPALPRGAKAQVLYFVAHLLAIGKLSVRSDNNNGGDDDAASAAVGAGRWRQVLPGTANGKAKEHDVGEKAITIDDSFLRRVMVFLAHGLVDDDHGGDDAGSAGVRDGAGGNGRGRDASSLEQPLEPLAVPRSEREALLVCILRVLPPTAYDAQWVLELVSPGSSSAAGAQATRLPFSDGGASGSPISPLPPPLKFSTQGAGARRLKHAELALRRKLGDHSGALHAMVGTVTATTVGAAGAVIDGGSSATKGSDAGRAFRTQAFDYIASEMAAIDEEAATVTLATVAETGVDPSARSQTDVALHAQGVGGGFARAAVQRKREVLWSAVLGVLPSLLLMHARRTALLLLQFWPSRCVEAMTNLGEKAEAAAREYSKAANGGGSGNDSSLSPRAASPGLNQGNIGVAAASSPFLAQRNHFLRAQFALLSELVPFVGAAAAGVFQPTGGSASNSPAASPATSVQQKSGARSSTGGGNIGPDSDDFRAELALAVDAHPEAVNAQMSLCFFEHLCRFMPRSAALFLRHSPAAKDVDDAKCLQICEARQILDAQAEILEHRQQQRDEAAKLLLQELRLAIDALQDVSSGVKNSNCNDGDKILEECASEGSPLELLHLLPAYAGSAVAKTRSPRSSRARSRSTRAFSVGRSGTDTADSSDALGGHRRLLSARGWGFASSLSQVGDYGSVEEPQEKSDYIALDQFDGTTGERLGAATRMERLLQRAERRMRDPTSMLCAGIRNGEQREEYATRPRGASVTAAGAASGGSVDLFGCGVSSTQRNSSGSGAASWWWLTALDDSSAKWQGATPSTSRMALVSPAMQQLQRQLTHVAERLEAAIELCERASAEDAHMAHVSRTNWRKQLRLKQARDAGGDGSAAIASTAGSSSTAGSGTAGGQDADEASPSAALWFDLLDVFVASSAASALAPASTVGASDAGPKVVPSLSGAAMEALRDVRSECVRITLLRMAGRVPLKRLMRKITSDHGRDRFAEFRQTILGMIETSTYQHKIYEATKTLKREDGFKLVLQRHRARSARFPQDRVRFLQPRGRSRSEAALRSVGDSEDGEQESVDEESVRLRIAKKRAQKLVYQRRLKRLTERSRVAPVRALRELNWRAALGRRADGIVADDPDDSDADADAEPAGTLPPTAGGADHDSLGSLHAQLCPANVEPPEFELRVGTRKPGSLEARSNFSGSYVW